MILAIKILLALQVLLLIILIASWLYYKISVYLLYWRTTPTIKEGWEAYKRETK